MDEEDLEAMNLVKLKPVKEQINIADDIEVYMSISEYVVYKGYNKENIDIGETGLFTTIFCKQNNIPIKSIATSYKAQYKKINKYPVSILEIVFYTTNEGRTFRCKSVEEITKKYNEKKGKAK